MIFVWFIIEKNYNSSIINVYEKKCLYNRRDMVDKFLPGTVIAGLQVNLCFYEDGAFLYFVGGK